MVNGNIPQKDLFGHYKENDLYHYSMSHYSLISSYSKNAETPVCFTRYTHKHTFAPYTSVPRKNNWCSLYVFVSGRCTFLLENNIYTLTGGDAIFINNHEEYRSQFQLTPLIDYYEIDFPCSFFEEISAPNIFHKMFYNRAPSEKNYITLDKEKQAELMNKLKKAEESSRKSEDVSDFLSYSYLIQAIEILYSSFTSASDEHSNQQPPQKLADAASYIHEHFLTITTVDEIAASCNISATYLQRIFKKHLSTTPTAYINELRISYAKNLIQNGESLTSACYNSGFSDYTYFASKFKSITSISPSQFKKEMQK
ncbi:MAG: helix-turn-helix transcriptional regulator [Oscillospiraceae bacterium]|nr:helix-turn-helix transcriptional regulator [Oscillospiraceae bacterium]